MISCIIMFSVSIFDLLLFNLHISLSRKYKRVEKEFLRGFRWSFLAIRLFTVLFVLLFIVRIVLCSINSDDTCLGFGVVMRNQFFFIKYSFNFDERFVIVACVFLLLTTSFVPYVYCAMRIMYDKNFNRFDAYSSCVFALFIGLLQVGVFVSSLKSELS